jgi:uncharacterized protein YbgA (DUF1722 family)/uncharacterized protein YbbK (DUF523 family)
LAPRIFPVPRIVISKCIEFEDVRWDGGRIASAFVRQLTPYIDPILVCPEVEIGLGVPRDPVRLVSSAGTMRLLQPRTEEDLTVKMTHFIQTFFDSLPAVDGFILKNRSPTSAIRDAKIYLNTEKNASPLRRGPGIFGAAVLNTFPHLAIEDDGRLRNPRIKEHFLTKIYTLASFRAAKTATASQALLKFHTENKLLLKAYSQKNLRNLGRLVATRDEQPDEAVVREYAAGLFAALRRPPRCGADVNVMMTAMGYFSQRLSSDEKKHFLALLEKYRNGTLPKSVVLGVLRSWILRFQSGYLGKQTYFEPYPEPLQDIEAASAYCDKKDYWK